MVEEEVHVIDDFTSCDQSAPSKSNIALGSPKNQTTKGADLKSSILSENVSLTADNKVIPEQILITESSQVQPPPNKCRFKLQIFDP